MEYLGDMETALTNSSSYFILQQPPALETILSSFRRFNFVMRDFRDDARPFDCDKLVPLTLIRSRTLRLQGPREIGGIQKMLW
jgi:hypothetical protein